jgi:hypothetical protein
VIAMNTHKALYAYYEGDELIAVGTARELSNMLHITINNIRRRARKEKDIIKVGYIGDKE